MQVPFTTTRSRSPAADPPKRQEAPQDHAPTRRCISEAEYRSSVNVCVREALKKHTSITDSVRTGQQRTRHRRRPLQQPHTKISKQKSQVPHPRTPLNWSLTDCNCPLSISQISMNEASRRADLRTPAINTTPSKFTIETLAEHPKPAIPSTRLFGKDQNRTTSFRSLVQKTEKTKSVARDSRTKKVSAGAKIVSQIQAKLPESHENLCVQFQKSSTEFFGTKKQILHPSSQNSFAATQSLIFRNFQVLCNFFNLFRRTACCDTYNRARRARRGGRGHITRFIPCP